MHSNKRGSGSCCSAIGCSMRRGTNLLSQVKMFRFPADPNRRAAWCNAVKREGWTPNKNSLLCNSHFVTGKPSTDPQHPDYVPSLFSFTKDTAKVEKKLQRYERSIKRVKLDLATEASSSVSIQADSQSDVASIEDVESPHDVASSNSSNLQHVDVEVQTDISMKDVELFEKKMQWMEDQNATLRKKSTFTETYNRITKCKKRFKFYTGIETLAIFNSILAMILSVWQPEIKVSLKPCEQLLLVFMKLRLGLLNKDLACRFQIAVGNVSKVFHSWLNIMFINLNRLIIWPSRREIKRNMPRCFKNVSLGNVRCIIDCTEIFIQKPKNLEARAQTYSNYKNHNTVKFLVGITPSGVICFISKAWGGRVSDKQLTIDSGFLELLEKDDVILADRGFRIEDLLSEKNATLYIPASTKNKAQLSADEVRQSRKMSKVRVHVERAIRKIKIFKILDSNVPISMIKRKQDEEDNKEEFSTIDKILTVVCALCNLSNPILKI